MPRTYIHSADDLRLEPYRNLLRSRPAARSGLFVVEGQLLVERLVASRFEVHSVLISQRRLEGGECVLPEETNVLVAPGKLLESVVGFNFHRGILACGRRRPDPDLRDLIADDAARLTLVVAVDVQDPENLGTLIRNSAAFGADAVLLGPHCPDAFSRRILRVSMGTVFKLPVLRPRDLAAELGWLRSQRRVQLAATVLDGAAEPLESCTRPPRFALLLGSEAHGLSQDWLGLCDRRITIPMHGGTDSLNVAIATAVFLYHFSRDGVVRE